MRFEETMNHGSLWDKSQEYNFNLFLLRQSIIIELIQILIVHKGAVGINVPKT